MAHADHGLFHRVWGIFANYQPCLRGHQQGNAARLAQFQCGHRIFVDKRMLYCCRIGGIGAHNVGQLAVQRHKALGKGTIIGVRMADAIGDMGDFRPHNVNHTPPEVPQARINPQNPHVFPLVLG